MVPRFCNDHNHHVTQLRKVQGCYHFNVQIREQYGSQLCNCWQQNSGRGAKGTSTFRNAWLTTGPSLSFITTQNMKDNNIID